MKKYFTFLFVLLSFFLITGCGSKTKETNVENNNSENNTQEQQNKEISIIDMNSNSRPYAVVINNFPGAVKVQTGLSDAYMVYEFPVEGEMSRSLALFKDKDTAKIGTVRSARHNFLDYVLENDAIFVHYGWSHYAEEQLPTLGINNINGLYDSPFWRENPEHLATEHTAYTSLVKVKETAKKKGYKTTTEVKPPLHYSVDEINLSSMDGNIEAKEIEIPYGSYYKVKFAYDEVNKVYNRYVNNKKHTDYFTKEEYKSKNIIVVKLNTPSASDNYYLDLQNIGTGKGYYITNGYAREITWEKKDRQSQTIYRYSDGTEVSVNDGNTYIMFQSNSQKLSIN